MQKLIKGSKKLNFKVNSKFYYFEPIKEKYIGKRYLNWINNPSINQFLTEIITKKNINDLFEKINFLRKNEGELYTIHKKDKSHIGNITITNLKKNNSGYYGLMIGDQKSRDIGAGGYITLMVISAFFDFLKFKKISVASSIKNYKAINTLKKVGFRSVKIKNNIKYFELNKNKWAVIKSKFLFDTLRVKILKK